MGDGAARGPTDGLGGAMWPIPNFHFLKDSQWDAHWRIWSQGSISEVAAKRPLDISRDAYVRGPSRGKSKLASSIHSHNWPGGRQIVLLSHHSLSLNHQ